MAEQDAHRSADQLATPPANGFNGEASLDQAAAEPQAGESLEEQPRRRSRRRREYALSVDDERIELQKAQRVCKRCALTGCNIACMHVFDSVLLLLLLVRQISCIAHGALQCTNAGCCLRCTIANFAAAALCLWRQYWIVHMRFTHAFALATNAQTLLHHAVFIAGCCFLPLFWLTNAWLFWPYVRGRRHNPIIEKCARCDLLAWQKAAAMLPWDGTAGQLLHCIVAEPSG